MTRAFASFTRPSFGEGLGRILDVGATLDTYDASSRPELSDARAVSGDIAAVADELRAAVRKVASGPFGERTGTTRTETGPVRDRQTPPVPELPAIPRLTLTEVHSGPLPDPETLAAYDQIAPGTSERLLRLLEVPHEMAVEQQAHRIDLEKKVIASDIRRSWAGLVVGAVVVAGVVTGGIALILGDKPVEGLAALVTALGAPLGAFLYADRQRRSERQQRRSPEQ